MEMATWLKTTESSFTREMCSMASRKRNKSSSLYWMARRLSALLAGLCEEKRGCGVLPYQKRDDAYRLFPGFGFMTKS